MSWNPEQPFNELPLLPPTVEIENISILKACIPARTALAELKQAGGLLINQNILINLLPLLESKYSSEIENIVTTAEKLLQYAATYNRHADQATKEAMQYNTALYHGYQELEKRPLSTNVVVEICSTIKSTHMDVRKTLDTKLANPNNGRIIYTPPVGEKHLRDLLSNWEKFLYLDDSIDPLIIMAIAHYQFEAIHPFTDGNGRTGRVINILYLAQRGLLNQPILYLSRYILKHKNDYYTKLLEVTSKQNWEEWILFMLKAIEETALWTIKKIQVLYEIRKSTSEFVRDKSPKIYSHELIDVIFETGYCKIEDVISKKIVKRQTASVYLKELCNLGVLFEQQIGKDKVFFNKKIFDFMKEDKDD